MKGFKDKNNKFHPITQSLGVRKSRDQRLKTQGVRLQRIPYNINKYYNDIMIESARMRGDLYDPITKTYSEPSRGHDIALAHCGGTSCAINKKFGKENDLILVRGNVLYNGIYEDHAWNRNKQGDIIDASRDQFGDTKGIHIIKPTDKRYHSYTEELPSRFTLPQELFIQNEKREKKRGIRGFAEVITKEDTLGEVEAGMVGLR